MIIVIILLQIFINRKVADLIQDLLYLIVLIN